MLEFKLKNLIMKNHQNFILFAHENETLNEHLCAANNLFFENISFLVFSWKFFCFFSPYFFYLLITQRSWGFFSHFSHQEVLVTCQKEGRFNWLLFSQGEISSTRTKNRTLSKYFHFKIDLTPGRFPFILFILDWFCTWLILLFLNLRRS